MCMNINVILPVVYEQLHYWNLRDVWGSTFFGLSALDVTFVTVEHSTETRIGMEFKRRAS